MDDDLIDDLVRTGVHEKLAPLRASPRTMMTDAKAQERFDATVGALDALERALGRTLKAAREAIEACRNDSYARVS